MKQREGNLGKVLDYVEGHTVIKRLNDDIDSGTRSAWDIGADESGSAGFTIPATPTPTFTATATETATPDWYSCTYPYRKQITINSAMVGW